MSYSAQAAPFMSLGDVERLLSSEEPSPPSARPILRVLGLPESGARSRVETQMNLGLALEDASGGKVTKWKRLALPSKMALKKNKSMPAVAPAETLSLQARVVCSESARPVTVCLGCVQRERKRRRRRQNVDDVDDVEAEQQMIVVFNCGELVDFSSGDVILPTRITCYCRHHSERIGFRVSFSITDSSGACLAECMSPPIMITDDHKSSRANGPGEAGGGVSKRTSKRKREDYSTPPPLQLQQQQQQQKPHHHRPITPDGPLPFGGSVYDEFRGDARLHPDDMDEDDEYYARQHPSRRTSTASSPISLSASSPPSSLFSSTTITTPGSSSSALVKVEEGVSDADRVNELAAELSMPYDDQQVPPRPVVPCVERVIPKTGPMVGGIECTVLGHHFAPGMAVFFGNQEATEVHCWSASTLVCRVPASPYPGEVPVTVLPTAPVSSSDPFLPPVMFVYEDDTERDLLRLALQVITMQTSNGQPLDPKLSAMSILWQHHIQQQEQQQSSSGGSGTGSSGAPSDTLALPTSAPSDLNNARRLLPILIDSLQRSLPSQSSLETQLIDSLSCIQRLSVSEAHHLNLRSERTGHTLLHLATICGYTRLASVLLECGADLDQCDRDGLTPLHFAAWRGSVAMTTLLVEGGASVDVCNALGWTASELAPARMASLFVHAEEGAASSENAAPINVAVTVTPKGTTTNSDQHVGMHTAQLIPSAVSYSVVPVAHQYRKRDRLLYNLILPILAIMAAVVVYAEMARIGHRAPQSLLPLL